MIDEANRKQPPSLSSREALAKKCRPLPGQVLVKLALTQKYRSSVLHMPASTRVKTNIGKVLRVGEGCTHLREGMYVLLAQFSMKPLFQSELETSFFNEQNRYAVLDEADVLAQVSLKEPHPHHE